MQTFPCDIALLPSPSLSKRAIAASKKLTQFDSLFTLGRDTYYPHLSLYMLQLRTDDVPGASALLASIAASYASLTLGAVRYSHEEGYIDAEYKKPQELVRLQDEIVQAFNPIRVGLRTNDQQHMEEAEGLELENYKKYGYRYIGQLFRPHLTFGRLPVTHVAALEVLGDITEFSGTFPSIGLFTMGRHGTALHKLADAQLARAAGR